MANKNDKEKKPFKKIEEEERDEKEVEEEEEEEEESDEDDESEEEESDDDAPESEDDEDKEKKDSKKNRETPEQRHARLKRQLARQEKSMGITSDKDEKPAVKKKFVESSLSQADLYALLKADVAEDDVSEVVDYAKLKKIPVAEALKSNIVKAILKERSEERETAEATSTSTSRRSNSRPTPDALLDNARKGNMPESDADIDALIKARRKAKK